MTLADRIKLAETQMVEARKTNTWYPYKEPGNGGTGGRNVLTGAIKLDGKAWPARLYPCHNPIHQFKDADVIWSCFSWRTSEAIARYYLDWLREFSPWAKCKVVPWQDRDFQFNEGFIVGGIDAIPANLLHNFLIASRLAGEWPSQITAWHELVTEHKIDPALAFLFLTCFTPVNQISGHECIFDSKVQSLPAIIDKYDWPLDMARADETYVKNFLKGKAVGISEQAFCPTAVTAPVNTVWGKLLDVKSEKTYVNFLKTTYEKDYTVDGNIRRHQMDGSVKTITKLFTPESLLEVLKLEQERLIK